MFKNFLSWCRLRSGKGTLFALASLVWLVGGCQTSRSLPRVDLEAPGWAVRSGQAIWSPGNGRPEIAGELLLATRLDGTSFVQFTKTPFPVVQALQTSSRWYFEVPARARRYSGPGKPPKALVWLWLPRLLAGETVPRNWVWAQEGSRWCLTTSRGETIRGFLEP